MNEFEFMKKYKMSFYSLFRWMSKTGGAISYTFTMIYRFDRPDNPLRKFFFQGSVIVDRFSFPQSITVIHTPKNYPEGLDPFPGSLDYSKDMYILSEDGNSISELYINKVYPSYPSNLRLYIDRIVDIPEEHLERIIQRRKEAISIREGSYVDTCAICGAVVDFTRKKEKTLIEVGRHTKFLSALSDKVPFALCLDHLYFYNQIRLFEGKL